MERAHVQLKHENECEQTNMAWSGRDLNLNVNPQSSQSIRQWETFDYLTRAATTGWFFCLEVHLAGPLMRTGGFKINRDVSLRAIFCMIRALRRNPCLFNFAGAKAMNLSSIEVQGDNKQVVKLLCVTEAEPSSLGMCFHCFQIFVPRMDLVWSLETSVQFLLQVCVRECVSVFSCLEVHLVGPLIRKGGFKINCDAFLRAIFRMIRDLRRNQCLFKIGKVEVWWRSLEVHLVGPLLRKGGFKINRDASLRAIFRMIRALQRNPCLFNFAGAKAMNLSSIEVQGDNKQVVKLLCVTEAEPSSLGMCFHCFQIFVLTDMEISLSFCWCSYILGRQTRQPTGLHNPLTKTNPRPFVLQDRVEKRKDDDSLNEENDLFAIIDTSMIGLKWIRFGLWKLLVNFCCRYEDQVAGDGFIGLEVHLVGPLLRRGGFKINHDASSGAIICIIKALRRNPCLFNFAGAKAMNLSSIEVQGDNKQVVKLLCVTEAEPSSLGMCFHCFQIFVLRVWRYLFHFPGVLGRQTRRPTGLQNPLTRINHLSHGFLALFGSF
ncbi:hypothetical protein RHMOL_Rhmol11G0220500 [Rhododendron molle]|uniref:Uncharacterized protein n=1 Tax=Rhododendron molle TaxID=49168 RepID=A0ACC0LWN1_RHOML|nr:hypothetical protein RHMOL_Rhmol11G0220500 [Rhododendron molle]